jgi:hypothetical protein
MKYYNQATLARERAANKYSVPLCLYGGSKEDNARAVRPNKLIAESAVQMSENWKNSDGYFKAKTEINSFIDKYRNDITTPTVEEIEEFFARIQLDITKRYMEKGDLTSLIATEVTNENFNETVSIKEFLKYVGKFGDMALTGDSVPLIESNTGRLDSVTFNAYGLGFANTLRNVLWNSFYDIAKVNEAVSDAYIDKRNSLTIGAIVDHSYTTAQTVAAVSVSGQTSDENMYDTLDNAEDALRELLDPRTDRKINVPSISLLINSTDKKRISRVIDGQLNAFGKTPARNLPALNIDSIIEYDRGITDGYTVGKEEISFPGVTAGTAYMFVPKEYFWVLNKRGLTMEMSEGNALTLTKEEKAWYFISTKYDTLFFGEEDGYGAIVKITLPA